MKLRALPAPVLILSFLASPLLAQVDEPVTLEKHPGRGDDVKKHPGRGDSPPAKHPGRGDSPPAKQPGREDSPPAKHPGRE